jgi:hypothetical protein
MDPFSYRTELAADTVKAVSEIDSRIVFTIYAPEDGRPRSQRVKPRPKQGVKRVLNKKPVAQ